MFRGIQNVWIIYVGITTRPTNKSANERERMNQLAVTWRDGRLMIRYITSVLPKTVVIPIKTTKVQYQTASLSPGMLIDAIYGRWSLRRKIRNNKELYGRFRVTFKTTANNRFNENFLIKKEKSLLLKQFKTIVRDKITLSY